MCGVGLSGLFSCVSACDAVREPVLREGAGGSDGMGWLAAVGAGWGGPSGKRGEERGQVGPTGWGAAWGGAGTWGGPGRGKRGEERDRGRGKFVGQAHEAQVVNQDGHDRSGRAGRRAGADRGRSADEHQSGPGGDGRHAVVP